MEWECFWTAKHGKEKRNSTISCGQIHDQDLLLLRFQDLQLLESKEYVGNSGIYVMQEKEKS